MPTRDHKELLKTLARVWILDDTGDRTPFRVLAYRLGIEDDADIHRAQSAAYAWAKARQKEIDRATMGLCHRMVGWEIEMRAAA